MVLVRVRVPTSGSSPVMFGVHASELSPVIPISGKSGPQDRVVAKVVVVLSYCMILMHSLLYKIERLKVATPMSVREQTLPTKASHFSSRNQTAGIASACQSTWYESLVKKLDIQGAIRSVEQRSMRPIAHKGSSDLLLLTLRTSSPYQIQYIGWSLSFRTSRPPACHRERCCFRYSCAIQLFRCDRHSLRLLCPDMNLHML